jgi:hypothetical protein
MNKVKLNSQPIPFFSAKTPHLGPPSRATSQTFNMFVNYTLLIFVINAITCWSLVSAGPVIMEESPAFAARQARQIVQEEGEFR